MAKKRSLLPRAAGAAVLIGCALAGYGVIARAQQTQPDSAVLVDSKGVFVVDFTAGTASVVAIDVSMSVKTLVSPDQSLIAVINADGLTVYSLQGGRATKLGNFTRTLDTRAAWSADSSSLAFIHRAGGRTEVRLWSRATGQVKVLL